MSRRYAHIAICVIVLAAAIGGFNNFSRVNSAQENRILKEDAKQALAAARLAAFHLGQARVAKTPAQKKAHLKKAKALTKSVQAYKKELAARGYLRSTAGNFASCQVVNEPCLIKGTEVVLPFIAFDAQNENVCLTSAIRIHRQCGSMTTASYYVNGVAQGRRIVGSTCILTVPECPAHPEWEGTFRAKKPEPNKDQNACLQRAAAFAKACKSTDPASIKASYYVNGGLRGMATGGR